MMSLIPPEALLEIAKVFDFGARKYSPNNWRGGLAYSRVLSAALRHINSWNSGIDRDDETGLNHLAHAAVNLMFLIAFQETNLGQDDRYGR
jgi:hypothetical protein